MYQLCLNFRLKIRLSSNDNLIKKTNKILVGNEPKQDSEKVIFNFSKVCLGWKNQF